MRTPEYAPEIPADDDIIDGGSDQATDSRGKLTLNVSEIFYSVQGEGARAGSANIFIRLQGCKTKDACYASGIRCDTEFESGRVYTLDELYAEIMQYPSRAIIWTGGEPAQQLDTEIVWYFRLKGFWQAIETSGLFPVPANLDYVALSPKVAEHVIKKNFPDGVDELRYVRHRGQSIPQPSVTAKFYFVSPHSDGFNFNQANVEHCKKLVKENPIWKLSVQFHKLWMEI